MLPFIAALLMSSALAADVQAANLPGVFEATCLDGHARLAASQVSPISFDQLPPSLQKELGKPASGSVWRLNTTGRAYLYVLNYEAGAGGSPKICGLAADGMDLNAATDVLGARLGRVDRPKGQSVQWLSASDGYVATATAAEPFNVLQINWLSEADKAAAQARVKQIR